MQIQKIISSLPELKSTTIIIAQHMARGFIPSFIKRLQEHSVYPVEKAENGERLQVGCIYVCIGHTEVIKRRGEYCFTQEASVGNTYNPDINLIFNSIVPLVDDFNILSAILTGIGEDGVEGCRALSEGGSRCLTETSESAIVDGMPCRARESISNIEVLEMDEIVKEIREFCR